MDQQERDYKLMMQKKAQVTFNSIGIAFIHKVIPRDLAIECLSYIFGENQALRHMEIMEQIDNTKIPPLPPQFDVEINVFQQCRDLKQLWDNYRFQRLEFQEIYKSQ
ncbi:hypothetical protein CYY_007990 [Polysphondylium violaceum]|uniref:Uncharacterized protein n=1 Tax=Polysphondylium violaceum TaxID=133409 RepID=A0A8J4PNU8_9MYCE|nr:hypothetical protein CYY_007990 [Polysphondylium violaceum]